MHSVILTTVSNKDNALLIARGLVEARLCACVSIIPSVTSVYVWKGDLCEEGELLLFIKAPGENFEKIEAKILELHEYELPEIIALPVEKAYTRYSDWIDEQTRQLP